MKKIIASLLVAALITGCGGGSTPASVPEPTPAQQQTPAPAPTQEPAPTTARSGNKEDLPDFAVYLLENADFALAGETSAEEAVLFIHSEDIGVISFIDDNNKSVSYVGPVRNNGDYYEVYDEEMDSTFAFEFIEELDDGSYIADMGDLGEIHFSEISIEKGVELAMLIDSETTDVGGSGSSGGSSKPEPSAKDQEMLQVIEYLLTNAMLSCTGVSSDGDDVVFIQAEDIAVIAFANGDFESVSFIGEYEVGDDGSIAIYDESNGTTFGFLITEMFDDGSFVADIGDLGEIGFEVTTAEEAVTLLMLISELTDPQA